MEAFWQNCLQRLQEDLSPQQFSTWIKPLRFEVATTPEQPMRLYAPNTFILKWVKERYFDLINTMIHDYFGQSLPLEFEIEGINPALIKTDNSQANETVGSSKTNFDTRVSSNKSSESQLREMQRSERFERTRLISSFSFDNLIVGKANDLARAAAVQITSNPGNAYNPLFIYGGAGLGKTHLLHAIGNKILSEFPDKIIRYAHAEDYYTDVVRAYQQKAFDVLKHNYRSLDVLLIDDVQFFNGKGRTQEEFFFVFNALVDAKKQIVITCDTYPKDINGLDHRLVTRFDWGLTVQIEPPEIEMRVAILKKKAEAEEIDLSDDIAFLIAKHLRSNVRELEGALNKVIAYSAFYSRAITMDLATEALKDIIRPSRIISIEDIQKTVADYYKIKMADMFSKKRTRAIVKPRQVAMWLCKEVTSNSFPSIGTSFGGRDHTTVIHAVRTIEEEKKLDSTLNHDLHVLIQTLRGN